MLLTCYLRWKTCKTGRCCCSKYWCEYRCIDINHRTLSYAWLNSVDSSHAKGLCRLHAFAAGQSMHSPYLMTFRQGFYTNSIVKFSLLLSLYQSRVIRNAIICKLFTTACPTGNMLVQNIRQFCRLLLQFTLNVLRVFHINANLIWP